MTNIVKGLIVGTIFGIVSNMLVCDGATVSANPGVNPSLTITAMTERAMSIIAHKKASGEY